MGVIESHVAPQQTPLISVVGAVKVSGVYAVDGKTTLLSELITAAGGLSDNASSTIRVLRNGRPGLQYYYRPDSTDVAMAGDIVIAVPKPSVLHQKTDREENIVPVICLGLQDRPVCLPLDPSIASVEMLTRQLGQSEELGATAIVYDPFSRRDQRYLVSGSVVIFNSQLVNPLPFRAPETFPPTLPLKAPEVETTAPAVTQTARAEDTEELQLPKITPDASAPAMTVAEETPAEAAPLITPGSSNEPASIFDAPTSVVTVDPAPEQELADTEPANNEPADNETVAEVSAPAIAVSNGPLLMPSPASEEELAATVSWELEQEKTKPPTADSLFASVSSTDPGPEPTLAEGIDSAPAPPADAEMLSLNTNPVHTVSSVAPISEADSKLDKLLDRQINQPQKSDTSSWLFVALGVSCMAVSFLGLSIMWSRWDRKRDEETIANMEPVTTEAKPEPVVESAVQEATEILDQAVPVIEEQVLMPQDVALHGVAIGHRRIVIHDKHETLAGPHFNRKSRRRQTVSATKQATAERKQQATSESIPADGINNESFLSDESLIDEQSRYEREAAKQDSILANETASRSDGGGSKPSPAVPVHTESSQSYDVVQQDGHADHSAADGPLDRALRAIAREARS